MTDREKVIKRLEMCISNQKSGFAQLGCSHDGCTIAGETCVLGLMADALALLKAQEPVEPIRDINGVYYCGICDTICVGYEVEFTHSITKVENYCHKCGRKVKWE